EDGELRPVRQVRGERVDEPRQVPLDELPLERDGRRGDHDGPPGLRRVPDRGDQVGERLAGAGARLHGEVLRIAHRLPDGLGHLDLTGALHPAEAAHGDGEEFFDRRRLGMVRGHGRTVPCRTDVRGHPRGPAAIPPTVRRASWHTEARRAPPARSPWSSGRVTAGEGTMLSAMSQVVPLPSFGEVFFDARGQDRVLRITWHHGTLVLSL